MVGVVGLVVAAGAETLPQVPEEWKLIPVNGKYASDTIQNYVFTSIRSHRYFEVPFHWLYCETTITSLGLCDTVPEGDYYLCWLGRSNNTHPLLKSVVVYQ